MATEVIMPRQGQSVESCIINKWYKQKGDKVAVGDILFSYETDKASFEEEAKTEGVLLEIFFGEGDEVECLKTVCVIGGEGESIEDFVRVSPKVKGGEGGSIEEVVSVSPLAVSGEGESIEDFVRISPRARALAEKTGADVNRAVPTGANDRIMEKDIRKAISEGYLATKATRRDESGISGSDTSGASGISGTSGASDSGASGSGASGSGIGGRITISDVSKMVSPTATVNPALRLRNAEFSPVMQRSDTRQGDGSPASPLESVPSLESASPREFEDVPLSNIRKVTAKTMHASLADSAQLTNHSSFDATDILNFRKTLKSIEGREDLAKITITDIIVYSVSRVLLKHRNLNAHLQGPVIRRWNNSHIGVAVDTPRGLLVPTIFNANQMTLTELSEHSKELIDKCKQKTITPDQLTGGSFTVSNLGGFGVEMFTPILNPPQTGLLGVCCIIERTKNGVPYPAMGLSLTYDHRAVDGADAARFQKDLIAYLENFTINLLIEGAI